MSRLFTCIIFPFDFHKQIVSLCIFCFIMQTILFDFVSLSYPYVTGL